MKQLLCLLAIAILPATQSFSQTAIKKSTLSISAGPSFAIGNFSKTESSNPLSGFANAGQNLNLSYTFQLNRHIGIVGMLYGERNGLNTKALAQEYGNAVFFPSQDGTFRRYRNWEVDKSSWIVGSALIGLSAEFKPGQSDKVSIIAKALTGLVYLQSPKIDANSKSDTSYAELKRNKANGIGQSFFVSGGVKYTLGKRTALTLTGDFFATNQVAVKDVTEKMIATNGGLIVPGLYSIQNSRNGPIYSGYSGTFKQPVSSININLGFSFSL